MQVRRVVSGHDADGKSRFISDEIVGPARVGDLPLPGLAPLWWSDAAPAFPASGKLAEKTSYFPPLGGYRFMRLTLPPMAPRDPSAPPVDMAMVHREIERQVGSGLFSVMEPDNPGMHATDTIDFGVVLSGEVCLELDDGEEVVLKAGDAFVQNGTRHRWFNRGTEMAEISVVMVGGHAREEPAR